MLAVVGVGFVERDAMSAFGEGADDAAIVGGGAVPKSGDEAGAEEGDAKFALHDKGAAAHASAGISDDDGG